MEQVQNTKHKQQFSSHLLDVNKQLYYYALQLTEDADEAKNLLQETNYKALRHHHKLKHTKYQDAWLYTILRNTYINHLRSAYYKNTVNGNDAYDPVALASISEQERPDSLLDRKELKDQIRQLPPNYARPLRLYISGYSYKEIARMTKSPIGTVKSRIHLAKEKLKKVYELN
jgi:RNA polymerase sigma-70 factor (ECF subfamily)